jgi:hypothetical protein
MNSCLLCCFLGFFVVFGEFLVVKSLNIGTKIAIFVEIKFGRGAKKSGFRLFDWKKLRKKHNKNSAFSEKVRINIKI